MDRRKGSERRWRAHRFGAAAVRAAIALVPIAVGFVSGSLVADRLPEPTSPYDVVLWWATVVVVASVTATVTDRFARRFLPLSTMLGMTMLFPDRAPSRMKVALRAGNHSELRRRIADVQSGDTSRAESAELILSLATALSTHDRKTRGHSERTRAYTEIIAEEMGIPEDDRDKLRWAALLHDVGKLEVPFEVLNKDGPLSSEEWEVIRGHPVAGMRLVSPIVPWLGPWAKTIEHHHERWDGSGYPHGLAGTDIALGARIVSVADAYDVMTSGRSYQRAKTPQAARTEIVAQAGSQFDPTVARALMNASLGRLRWATGPLAVLAEIPFLRGLPQVGRDVAVLLTSTALMTTSLVTGAVPTPEAASPHRILEIVIAGAGLGDPAPSLAAATGDGGTSTPSVGGGTGDEGTTPTTTTGPASSSTTLPPDAGATSTTGTTTPGTGPTPTTTPPADTPATTDPPTTTTTTAAGPVVLPDVASTSEDVRVVISVLANDSDPDGDLDPTTLSVIDPPAAGSASVTTGRIVYTPDPDSNGADALVYEVCDLGGRCASAAVRIDVAPVNDAPVTAPDSASSDGGTVLVAVLANDVDPDGDPLELVTVGAPGRGTSRIVGDAVEYTPEPGWSGSDSFGYGVCDPAGACASAVVTVEVTAPAPGGPLTASDDDVSTRSGSAVIVKATANDTGAIDQRTLEIVSQPTNGTAERVGGSGNLRYAPDDGFVGVDRFSYRVCDPDGNCDEATVTVTVE